MYSLKDEVGLLFLNEINKTNMVVEIIEEEVFLCSARNNYKEKVSLCELAKLSEQFLMEKLGIWINANTKYYDINKGNKLTLSVGGNSRTFKFKSLEVVISFDEMKDFVDIKNDAIVEYVFQIFKSNRAIFKSKQENTNRN